MADYQKLSICGNKKFLEKLDKNGKFKQIILECPGWAHMETLENFAYGGWRSQIQQKWAHMVYVEGYGFGKWEMVEEMVIFGRNFWQNW